MLLRCSCAVFWIGVPPHTGASPRLNGNEATAHIAGVLHALEVIVVSAHNCRRYGHTATRDPTASSHILSASGTPLRGEDGASAPKERSVSEEKLGFAVRWQRTYASQRPSEHKQAEGRDVTERNLGFSLFLYRPGAAEWRPSLALRKLRNEAMGWLTGLEPATTGITIRDSTS
jgi:hypothetical protein